MEQRYRNRISVVVIIAVVVGLGFWEVQQAFANKGACAEDVAKFCKDVPPGPGRIVTCMKEHENDLSPGCKANIAEMDKKRHEAREECKDDVVRFCSDMKPGEGRVMNCLKEHEAELSPQCKSKMEKRRHKKAD